MARRAEGPRSTPRRLAVAVGVAHGVLALLEALLARRQPVVVGETTLLVRSAPLALLHAATAVVLLGSSLARDHDVRLAARLVGVVFVLLSILGIVAPGMAADVLRARVPRSIHVVHVITGAAGLYAAFARRAAPTRHDSARPPGSRRATGRRGRRVLGAHAAAR